MRKKIYGIFIALGMVAMISCAFIGAYFGSVTVMVAGFAFCVADFLIISVIQSVFFFKRLNRELKEEAEKARTAERERELIDEINSSQTVEDNKIAQAKYYGQGAESVGELIQACFGFTREGKENFRNSSKADKFKVVAVFASFGLLLLILFVGISLANAGTTSDGTTSTLQLAGFILMGIGGGGFFLVIFSLMIHSLVQRRRYFAMRKKGYGDAEYKAELCEGTVLWGQLHSQFSTGRHYTRIHNTLYQIMVVPDEGKKHIHFICSRLYQKGERVKFYRYKNKKCILIED